VCFFNYVVIFNLVFRLRIKQSKPFDALVIPGGFGAVKTLCTYGDDPKVREWSGTLNILFLTTKNRELLTRDFN